MLVRNRHEGAFLNELIKKEAHLSRLTDYSIKMVEGNGTQLNRLMPPASALADASTLTSAGCAVIMITAKKLSGG